MPVTTGMTCLGSGIPINLYLPLLLGGGPHPTCTPFIIPFMVFIEMSLVCTSNSQRSGIKLLWNLLLIPEMRRFCTTRDLSSNQTLWRDFSYLSTSTGWCRTSHKSTWIPPLKHLDRSSAIWAVVKTAGAVLMNHDILVNLDPYTNKCYFHFHLWKHTNKPFWHSMSHPGSLISESNISWLMKLSPHNLVVFHNLVHSMKPTVRPWK